MAAPARVSADLSGRIAIVTGATTGIGKEIARDLARCGATVVIPCRTLARGEAAADEIKKDTGNDKVVVMSLDLASQASIRAFSDEFRRRFDKLHILVNNAGGWQMKREDSPDGIEITFAINVLGYHLLTKLLLDLLKQSAPSRIVNMASSAAGRLDAGDLNFTRRKYSGFNAYMQSKQANRMLTWKLAKDLEGTGVTANAAHPGFVKSEFNRNVSGGILGLLTPVAEKLFARTTQQGADTASWLAASPQAEGQTGKLWYNRKEMKCKFRDPAAIEQLFEACERMTAGPKQAAA